jgi:hypothetical protein
MESLEDHDRTSGFKRAPRAPQHRFCRRLSSIRFTDRSGARIGSIRYAQPSVRLLNPDFAPVIARCRTDARSPDSDKLWSFFRRLWPVGCGENFKKRSGSIITTCRISGSGIGLLINGKRNEAVIASGESSIFYEHPRTKVFRLRLDRQNSQLYAGNSISITYIIEP